MTTHIVALDFGRVEFSLDIDRPLAREFAREGCAGDGGGFSGPSKPVSL